MKLPLWAWAAGACLLATTTALGAPRRVVVVAPAEPNAVATRVRDELRLLGLDVVVVQETDARRDLPQIARANDAAAAVRVDESATISIWVDPGPGITGGELHVEDTGGDSGVLALRAVELVRARLLPVPAGEAPGGAAPASSGATTPPALRGPGAPASPATSAPPRVARPAATERDDGDLRGARGARAETPRGFRLYVEPTLAVDGGGVSAAPSIRLGAGRNVSPWLSITATAVVPTLAGRVEADGGSVDVRTALVGAGLEASLASSGPWSTGVEAGLAAALVAYSGDAAAPLRAQSGTAWAVAPWASLGARYRLGRNVALRADAAIALLRPEPVLRIAGREIASVGAPAGLFSFGVELQP